MNNTDIRTAIMKAGLKYYEVAAAAQISPYTLSVWLRQELTGERLERVQTAIESLTTGGVVHE